MFFDDIFGGGMPGGMQRNREPVDTEELYKTLGIEKNASERDIKRAWKKAVKNHHPDRGGDEEVFKKCQQAHEVLSDPQKRSLYDQGGLEAVQSGGAPGPDIMSFFGGGPRRGRDTGPRKPASIKEAITIDLEDVFQGGVKKVQITKTVADDRDMCTRCKGQGSIMETVRRGPMILQSQRDCPRCGGRGISFTNERKVKKTLEVNIPAGVRDGDRQTLHDEGHELPGQPTGDVVITYKVKPHPVFKRIQADLAMAKEITLVDALCGCKFHVRAIDKADWLCVNIKPGQLQPGDVLKVNEQGLPQKGNRSTRGDLYIKFTIVLPKAGSLKNSTIDQLRKLLGPKNAKYVMPNQTQNETREIANGMAVKLIGLTNRPDLNGVSGKVIEANIKPGAHAVALSTGQTVSVREELLEITEKAKKVMKAEKPKQGDYVEEVSGEVVDLDNVSHTPYAYGHAHEDDSDDEREGVSCRQM